MKIMGVREARATLTAKVSKRASDHARKVTGVSHISEGEYTKSCHTRVRECVSIRMMHHRHIFLIE